MNISIALNRIVGRGIAWTRGSHVWRSVCCKIDRLLPWYAGHMRKAFDSFSWPNVSGQTRPLWTWAVY